MLPPIPLAEPPSPSPQPLSPAAGERGRGEGAPVSHEVHVDLAGEIDRLRKGNDRFRRVEYTVNGGVVHLRGSIQRGEDLMELAQAVSHLPGVERVIVTNVQVAR